jgi:hypothetical protein
VSAFYRLAASASQPPRALANAKECPSASMQQFLRSDVSRPKTKGGGVETV